MKSGIYFKVPVLVKPPCDSFWKSLLSLSSSLCIIFFSRNVFVWCVLLLYIDRNLTYILSMMWLMKYVPFYKSVLLVFIIKICVNFTYLLIQWTEFTIAEFSLVGKWIMKYSCFRSSSLWTTDLHCGRYTCH